jgi:hypothetical protein
VSAPTPPPPPVPLLELLRLLQEVQAGLTAHRTYLAGLPTTAVQRFQAIIRADAEVSAAREDLELIASGGADGEPELVVQLRAFAKLATVGGLQARALADSYRKRTILTPLELDLVRALEQGEKALTQTGHGFNRLVMQLRGVIHGK